MMVELKGKLYLPHNNRSSAQIVINNADNSDYIEMLKRTSGNNITGEIIFENKSLKFTTRVHEYNNNIRFFVPLSITRLLPKYLNKTNVIIEFNEQNNLIFVVPQKGGENNE